MTVPPTIDEIVQFRERHRISQPQLAARLGVTLRTVQSWEAGEFKPRPYLALALEALEVRLQARIRRAA